MCTYFRVEILTFSHESLPLRDPSAQKPRLSDGVIQGADPLIFHIVGLNLILNIFQSLSWLYSGMMTV